MNKHEQLLRFRSSGETSPSTCLNLTADSQVIRWKHCDWSLWQPRPEIYTCTAAPSSTSAPSADDLPLQGYPRLEELNQGPSIIYPNMAVHNP